MPQLTDDCFAHGGPMMTTAEALARIGEIASAVTDSETVPLASAAGRILAAEITAEGDVPPHDNSAVDGYAVYFDDLNSDGESRLPVTGRIAAAIRWSIPPGAVKPFASSPARPCRPVMAAAPTPS
jgi:molybdopterin molybdotransferase